MSHYPVSLCIIGFNETPDIDCRSGHRGVMPLVPPCFSRAGADDRSQRHEQRRAVGEPPRSPQPRTGFGARRPPAAPARPRPSRGTRGPGTGAHTSAPARASRAPGRRGNAREYLAGSQPLFDAAGISLRFKNYAGYPEYRQLATPFEPAVSIIDLLANVALADCRTMITSTS